MSAADAAAAGSACQAELTARGVSFVVSNDPVESPPSHPEMSCTIDDPVWVMPVLHGVTYRAALSDPPELLLTSCALALAMDDLSEHLAAAGVTDVVHLGAYRCTVISGTSILSEHAVGRAVDLAGFRFADERYWTVEEHWPAASEEPGLWLRSLAEELVEAGPFGVVLTPDFSVTQADHLHCQLPFP